ncbi:azurin [Imhoffiella purpurea]|uniref:Azurin n=1 Tax=Imhoffiella purpurea TaxID=1249627 RepID=W9VK55_9GAMM|nr:azurin [Imhoffiella purpurea]EXJ16467.1 azurin [Imhoffiella purpurea]
MRMYARRLLIIGLALAGHASAGCDLSIEAGDAMQYSRNALIADAGCERIRVTLSHTGRLSRDLVGQNWVLARTADIKGVAQDGFAAGIEHDFVAPGDARVLAATPLLGGGERATVEIPRSRLLPGEEYSYFCTFPGSWLVMRGRLRLR